MITCEREGLSTCQKFRSVFRIGEGDEGITTIFTSMIFPGKDNIKLRLKKGCEFLDIGCGSGNLMIDFAHIFKKSIFFASS